MNTLEQKTTSARRRWLVPVVIAIALVIVGAVWAALGGGKKIANDLPTAVVTRNGMIVSITASGEVMAQKKRMIANNLPYSVVIAERVDEGANVAAGDLIIRFECKELLDYASCQLEQCPFGSDKPTCAKCPVHCYEPDFRDRIREVMRFAGPRMILRHPVSAVCHLLDNIRPSPT